MPGSKNLKNALLPDSTSQLKAILTVLSAAASLAEIERIIYLSQRFLPALANLSNTSLGELLEELVKKGKLQLKDAKYFYPSTDEEADEILKTKPYTALADCTARVVPAIGNRGQPDLGHLKRDIRNAFFAADVQLLNSSLVNLRDYFPEEYNDADGFDFLLKKQNWDELAELPDELLAVCSWQLMPIIIRELFDTKKFAERLLEIADTLPPAAVFPLIDYEIICGNWNSAAKLIRRSSNNNARMLRQAWLSSIFAKDESAINLYLDSLYEVRQLEGAPDFYFQTVGGLFYIFSLLRTGSPDAIETAENNAELAKNTPGWGPVYEQLHQLLTFWRTHEMDEKATVSKNLSPLQEFFCIVFNYWQNEKLNEDLRKSLQALADKAEQGDYKWLYKECNELLKRTDPDKKTEAAIYHEDAAGKIPFLLDCLQVRDNWMKRFDKFDAFLNGLPKQSARRLTWLITQDEVNPEMLTVRPMEQHALRNGRWSKGRKFTAFRNQNYCRIEQDLDSFMSGYQLSPQDKFACTILRESLAEMEEDPARTKAAWGSVFLALTDHPRLFLDLPVQRNLKCQTALPYLKLLKSDECYEFQLCPFGEEDQLMMPILEHGDIINVYIFDNEFLQLRQLIGKELRIPFEAKDEMLELISSLSKRYRILTECSLQTMGLKASIAAYQPEIRLIPEKQGLMVDLFVKPFPEINTFYKPAEGPSELISQSSGKMLRLARDFALEQEKGEEILELCPALNRAEKISDWQWFLEDASDCFEFTLQLRDIFNKCNVHWPEESRFTKIRRVGLSDLSLRVQSYKDWFSLEGDLKVDDDIVTLQELLQKTSDDKGRFITLNSGQVIALNESFKQRLDELSSIAEYKNETYRVHHFLQPLLNTYFQGLASSEFCKNWEKQSAAIEEALKLEPELPETLQAELRKYQYEGFIWLSRLDALGAGACLADDMGLGKTVQAIAFILSKASEGPTLVIAPTSVCANWQHEFQRFAPSLEVVTLGNEERMETLSCLGPGTVLISSYGLLQSERDKFSKINWRIAVLDEAQAIKNFHAKRSQAAMKIKADFRLVTTGTPVENNLNELWTVFRFINPGLLGSKDQFQRRFGVPIERENDEEAMKRLNNLIKPFLLRRRKDQVLKELPPKTNVNLRIDLSKEEREFYDQVRMGILAELNSHNNYEEKNRIRVLAGITKLRLAVCHPRLIMPDSKLPGSKLEAFLELLSEILEGGHKALVFSQFVKFLNIVRQALDELGIEYQYLDGSLSTKERTAAVENFQGGNCPVFLISLKAGGLGLNLTEADYVIHLDSWWNPAVETQASDRAHRLGQEKAVTIYHLLTKNTIEEKIHNLHQWKCDLADRILSGNDKLTTFTIDDLIKLLSEDS